MMTIKLGQAFVLCSHVIKLS